MFEAIVREIHNVVIEIALEVTLQIQLVPLS